MQAMDGREIKRLVTARDLINRIHNDTRFAAELRTFAVTVVWVAHVDRRPAADRWQRVADLLGLNNWRFWNLISTDAPRYEPASLHSRTGCAVPRPRAGGPCGKSPQHTFRVTDPATGEWELAGFCSAHADYGDQVHRAEQELRAAGPLPEPMPNTGGLLPCYIHASWPDIYAQARGGWTPPRVGIRADDWPVMEQVAAAEPPTFRLITGGGNPDDHGRAGDVPVFLGGERHDTAPVPSGADTAPTLRLVDDHDDN
jgi:hypothetical protein